MDFSKLHIKISLKFKTLVDDYWPLWDYTTLYILGVTCESTANPDLNHLKVVNELFAAKKQIVWLISQDGSPQLCLLLYKHYWLYDYIKVLSYPYIKK